MRALRAPALAFLFFLLLPAGGIAGAAGDTTYDALVAQLKSGNTAIDYTALRYSRAELPGYNPYEALADPTKRDMFAAMASGNLNRVSMLANQILERDYTDIDAHAVLALVLERQ